MPKDKGPEWHHVVIESRDESRPDNLPTVHCLYCDKQFVAGALRIRGHLIGDRTIGLRPCSEAPESVVLKFWDIESRQVEERKEKQKLAAFNKATASTSNVNSGKQAFYIC